MTKSAVLLKIIPLFILAAATFPLVADVGRERVVFVCAHPDDLAGCSGTALLLAEKFDVRVIDFTKGEGGLGEAGFRDGSTAKMRMEEDRSRVAISLRTTRRAGDLFAQPIFYTEVHFQGDQKELKE